MYRCIAILLIGCWAVPAWSTAILSDMEARFEFEVLTDGSTLVHLLAGAPFGDGGIAAGLFTPPDPVLPPDPILPPDPVRWLALDAAGSATPDDTRVLSFSFDRTGLFSGVDPQPFRIFLENTVTLGELDFSNVSGVMMGSLTNITGLQLITSTGTLDIEPFDIRAVPEPSTLGLLGAGLLGLWFRKKAA